LGEAKHFDEGKPQLQWIPFEPLAEVARVFEFGAGKYGNHNYKSGMIWSKLVGSVLRHVFKWMNGEDKDDESGCSHLAHACCCCMMLLYYERYHPELDDRKGA
jgi:hypothetical protein